MTKLQSNYIITYSLNETKSNNVHYISMMFSILVFAINVLDMGPKTFQPHRSLVAFFFFPNLNLWLNSQQTITSKKKKITFFNSLMIRFFDPLYIYIYFKFSQQQRRRSEYFLENFEIFSSSLSLSLFVLPLFLNHSEIFPNQTKQTKQIHFKPNKNSSKKS